MAKNVALSAHLQNITACHPIKKLNENYIFNDSNVYKNKVENIFLKQITDRLYISSVTSLNKAYSVRTIYHYQQILKKNRFLFPTGRYLYLYIVLKL